MFSPDDTIAAIATPPGTGGLGVVRISGPDSHAIAQTLLNRTRPLEPRRATLARVPGVDRVVATWFAAPYSYTGQDVVEISAHGSPLVLRTILARAMEMGARLAEPGEFTLRAFLNGRIDLVQAEAVADLIDAVTPLQARTAFDQLEGTLTARIAGINQALFDLVARLEASLDFPDEGFHFIEPVEIERSISRVSRELALLLADAQRGRTIREGAQVVICGRPNVGKSSVFNQLAGHARAIVTPIPGTTRDLITERVDIGGVAITLVDTAGVRQAAEPIEHEGVQRARQAAQVATLLLVVLDQSEPLRDDDHEVLAATRERRRVVIRNKSDTISAWDPSGVEGQVVAVSALTGAGFDLLREAIGRALLNEAELRDPPLISNVRHVALLKRALRHLEQAAGGVSGDSPVPEEFLLSDLQQARAALEEVTGRRTNDDLLHHIFERFCVGK